MVEEHKLNRPRKESLLMMMSSLAAPKAESFGYLDSSQESLNNLRIVPTALQTARRKKEELSKEGTVQKHFPLIKTLSKVDNWNRSADALGTVERNSPDSNIHFPNKDATGKGNLFLRKAKNGAVVRNAKFFVGSSVTHERNFQGISAKAMLNTRMNSFSQEYVYNEIKSFLPKDNTSRSLSVETRMDDEKPESNSLEKDTDDAKYAGRHVGTNGRRLAYVIWAPEHRKPAHILPPLNISRVNNPREKLCQTFMDSQARNKNPFGGGVEWISIFKNKGFRPGSSRSFPTHGELEIIKSREWVDGNPLCCMAGYAKYLGIDNGQRAYSLNKRNSMVYRSRSLDHEVCT